MQNLKSHRKELKVHSDPKLLLINLHRWQMFLFTGFALNPMSAVMRRYMQELKRYLTKNYHKTAVKEVQDEFPRHSQSHKQFPVTESNYANTLKMCTSIL